MTPYKKAIQVLETEHEIVDVVFNYIDRMMDATSEDPLEKSAGEFIEVLAPVVDKHLQAIGNFLNTTDK